LPRLSQRSTAFSTGGLGEVPKVSKPSNIVRKCTLAKDVAVAKWMLFSK